MGRYSLISNQIGTYKIKSEGINFVSTIKPELSFPFDFIFYEPDANNYFYINQNVKTEMTREQKKECLEFCKEYIETQDYIVYTYNSKNIFSGEMLKSEAAKKKLRFCYIKPDFPVAKWTGENWEEIVLIVKADGSIIKYPASYCDQCIGFYTAKELEKNPELLKYDDKYHKWDMTTQEWIVVGNEFKDISKELEQKIREMFEVKRWKLYGKYTPGYERDMWNEELKEAYAYLNDKNVETPYIDGVLSVLKEEISKEEYMKKILGHDSNDFKFEHGKIHGELYNYLNRLKSIETLEKLKEFKKEIDSLTYSF